MSINIYLSRILGPDVTRMVHEFIRAEVLQDVREIVWFCAECQCIMWKEPCVYKSDIDGEFRCQECQSEWEYYDNKD